jgi:protein TonB
MIMVREQAGAFRLGRKRANSLPHERLIGLIAALMIEGAAVYALLMALGVVSMPPGLAPLQFYQIPPETKPTETPVAIPPDIEVPKIPVPVPPEITVTIPEDVVRNPITESPPPQPVQPKIASVEPPITFSAARALLATHTTPEYPSVSRRLGEQGTLRLKLTINAQGGVSDAMVVNSSGHPRLDEAAVDWVKAHWRYQPAMRGTTAVSSTADAVVTFKLQ